MPQVETRRLSHETLDVKPVQKEKSETDAVEMDPMQIVVTKSVVDTIVKEYDPSLRVVDFSAEAGSNVGDNYMAIMYAVNINVTKPGSNVTTPLNVMLKTMPLNAARQQMVNDSKVFVKEALMYATVFRDLEKFQKELGFADEEIYSDYPHCYATFVDGKADYLAMDNLKAAGYQMADRTQGLDRAHATIVMKSLARFHALSYVKFHGDFHKILQQYPDLEDSMWGGPEQSFEMMEMFIGQGLKNAASSLRDAGYEAEAAIIDGPEFQLKTVIDRMKKLSADPCKYAVIGHKDCWTNNMLFKYDKTEQPIGIKLIDFQLSHACSRTLDLMYFLTGCLREELANVTEEEFLKIYYDEFASFAKRLGFFEKELTFEQLVAEFNERRYFGIIMGCIALPFFYANKADVKDMEGLSSTVSEDLVTEFMSNMMNSVAAKRLSNIINIQVPKLQK